MDVKKQDDALSFMAGIDRLLTGIDPRVLGTYEDRKVALTKGPIEVSTVFVIDLKCYETALCDANDVYPVERYQTREAAVIGHDRWVIFARSADGKQIVTLPYPGLEEFLGSPTITLRAEPKKGG